MDEAQPKKSNMMLLVGGIAVVVLLLGGGFMLLNSNGATPSTQSQAVEGVTNSMEIGTSAPPQPASGTSELVSDETGVKTFNVEAGSFYYKPNEITVKKGNTVKIVMTAKDKMHDFTIDELNVKIPVTTEGNTSEVTFVAEEAGEFEFYCSVGSHRQQGQIGTLIVEE